jgi:hypothetical protein
MVRAGNIAIDVKTSSAMFQRPIEAAFVVPITESDTAIPNYRFGIDGDVPPVVFEYAFSQILNA